VWWWILRLVALFVLEWCIKEVIITKNRYIFDLSCTSGFRSVDEIFMFANSQCFFSNNFCYFVLLFITLLFHCVLSILIFFPFLFFLIVENFYFSEIIVFLILNTVVSIDEVVWSITVYLSWNKEEFELHRNVHAKRLDRKLVGIQVILKQCVPSWLFAKLWKLERIVSYLNHKIMEC